MASGCTSGTESRTTHGTSKSGWAGSSRVFPQVWRAKRALGRIIVRAGTCESPASFATSEFSQSAASVQ